MLIVHKALNGKAPLCISELLQVYTPSRNLRSSSMLLLSEPKSGYSWGASIFLQLRHASRTLYPLILDLVFVPQNLNLFSKLDFCHMFSRTNLIVSVFLHLFSVLTAP